ncbi:MAG: hypothetical protein ABIX28_22670 [Vicinamibacterales bacterium]
MLRFPLFPAVHTLIIGASVLVGSASAAAADRAGTVGDVPLPGGLRAALAASGDLVPADRSLFLLEVIRRTYDTPIEHKSDPREPRLRALLNAIQHAAPTAPPDLLPLPLPLTVWVDVVFQGRVTRDTLVAEILQSRNASLFYAGLMSLDDPTRAWLAAQPQLIAALSSDRATAFVLAAPGLRIVGPRVSLPGGPEAEPVWAALTGVPLTDPARVVRAVVENDDGRFAGFVGATAELTAAQLTIALDLAAPAPARIDTARRVHGVFDQLLARKSQQRRAFTRPALDPALLAASLTPGADGRIQLPGTRRLWSMVFDDGRGGLGDSNREQKLDTAGEAALDFGWLCEAVFTGDPAEHRRRYLMVLFASRRLPSASLTIPRDAAEAIRASALYPALIMTLERAGVTDLTVMAAAARRAVELTAIGDDQRATRALAQFQGLLAIVTRAGARRTLDPRAVTSLVASLVAVAPGKSGAYEGRLVCWLADWLQPSSSPAPLAATEAIFEEVGGPMEAAVVRLLAGAAIPPGPTVEWEGTRYRVDFAHAEAIRMVRAFGGVPSSALTSADTVVRLADALDQPSLEKATLPAHVEELRRALGADGAAAAPLPDDWRSLLGVLTRAAASGDVKAAARIAPGLRLVGDELLARGVTELAYAATLGERDGISIAAGDAARRHDFGVHTRLRRLAPWWLPQAGTDSEQRWRVVGSLLGLDLALADFMLVRLSNKPPPRAPTIDEEDRRVFVQTVALVSPASFTESGRDTLVTAMAKGRETLAGARSDEDAAAIATALGLSAQRRTALTWAVWRDPARVPLALSPAELFLLGAAPGERVDAWGSPATARLGCLCLRGPERQPWEIYAGRSHTGVSASALPDLTFRLTELLAELGMPPSLLAPVLTSAMLEFVTLAISRDSDDRRGPVEFVHALRRERVEAYLALLTTDGPLVPVDEIPLLPLAAQGARR